MLFNSYLFILLFLPVFLMGYFLLGKSSKYEYSKIWLIAMSFLFYAYMHFEYALLLLGSILINYGIIRWMEKQKKSRKWLLVLGIICNLFPLFICKYYNFFIDNINLVFKGKIPLIEFILPIGISFITFQQLSFLLDCYKDKKLRFSLIDYVAYISFFPKISSGPIVLFQEFLPQIQDTKAKRPRYDNLSKGIYQFAMGLAKKILLADTLAKLVAIGFADIGNLHTGSALIVMLSYSLQLYFDFSGYSDMAIGVALMLNIKLPDNFNSPYKSISVSDFWKRWHITLTRFFTKYVYIPLGGNRKGLKRTCINVMIVFLLSGLWHGANWTFILWGALHGILLVIERVSKRKIEKRPLIGWIFTFVFVNAAWIIFRSNSLNEAFFFISRIFKPGMGPAGPALAAAINEMTEIRILSRFGLQFIVDRAEYLPMLLFVAVSFLITIMAKNSQEKTVEFKFGRRQMATTVLLLFWSIISLSGVSTFLYSNF